MTPDEVRGLDNRYAILFIRGAKPVMDLKYELHEQGKRLYPGEYTVTEVAPAPGFQMKEPTTQKVILHGGESKTVTFLL